MRVHLFLLSMGFLIFTTCSSSPSDSTSQEPPKYSLNATLSPQGTGTLTIDPSQEEYNEGTTIKVMVNPDDEYVLNNWQGNDELNSNPISIRIVSDTNIVANMILKTYSLNVEINGNGTVSEKIVTPKTDYESGTIVELEAQPETGWELAYWGGDIESQENPIQLTIDNTKNVEAVFEPLGISIFGGILNDFLFSTNLVDSGGFITAGRTFYSSTDSDFLISKVDQFGNKEWSSTLGGNGFDAGIATIIEANDGGYLLVGSTQSGNGDFSSANYQGDGDIAIIKLTSEGDIQWVKLFGGSSLDTPTMVTSSASGGYLILGQTESSDGDFSGIVNAQNSSEIFLLKIDNAGTVSWINSFGSSGVDNAFDVIELDDGGFALTGYYATNDFDFSNAGLMGSQDGFILKTSSQGELVWVSSFKGSDTDVGRSIIENSQGELIVGGASSSDDGDFTNAIKNYQLGSSNAMLAKFNSTGVVQWINLYGGSGSFSNDFGRDLKETTNGSYLFVGSSKSENGDFSGSDGQFEDIFIVKADEAGNTEWIKNYGGANSDQAYSLAVSGDDSFIIVGATGSNTGIFSGLNRSENLDIRYYDAFLLSFSPTGSINN